MGAADAVDAVTGFHIEAVWAFVSVADDGDEGLIGFRTPDGEWLPLIAADEARLEKLRPLAEASALVSNREVRLLRFDTRTDVETFNPPLKGTGP